MIVFEICGGNESHPIYQQLEVANGTRQYDFLRSLVVTSLAAGRPFLSGQIVRALNFHAIVCLHAYAGEHRPCEVMVGAPDPGREEPYRPPEHYRVDGLMDEFINIVNREWERTDPVALAAFVLWRLNHIHPFINGNGRSARAASYFVLCVKLGQWLPGKTILPEMLRQQRDRYVRALRQVDVSNKAGSLDLTPLHDLMNELLEVQLNGGDASAAPPASPPTPAPAAGGAPAGPPILPRPGTD